MKVNIKGVIVLLLILLLTKGSSAFFGAITTMLDSVWQVIKMLILIAIQFPNELGITDWINARVFFLVLTVLFGAVGICLTTKQERRLLGIIVDIVAAVSLILTLAA